MRHNISAITIELNETKAAFQETLEDKAPLKLVVSNS